MLYQSFLLLYHTKNKIRFQVFSLLYIKQLDYIFIKNPPCCTTTPHYLIGFLGNLMSYSMPDPPTKVKHGTEERLCVV